jgi:hypothetical protein
MERRRFIGTLGCLTGVSFWGGIPLVRGGQSGNVALSRIAQILIETPRDRVFDLVVKLHRDEVGPERLLGAVLTAAAQEIRPRPVGFKLHAAMVVGSTFDLVAELPEGLRMPAVLYCVDELKRSLQRDIRAGDWQMPPQPRVDAGSAAKVRAQLVSALENWRDEDADRAVCAAFAALPLTDLYQILWLYAVRDYVDIAHKPIYAAQAYRALQHMDPTTALPVLRSLVKALLRGGPDPWGALFDRNRERVARIRDTWWHGEAKAEASSTIARQLLEPDADGAATIVVNELNRGIAPATVWDGIRLAAADLLYRRPGLLAVHPVTGINSLHIAYQATQENRVRALILFQAAAWIPLFRDELRRRVGLSMSGSGLLAADVSHIAADRSGRDQLRHRLVQKGDNAHHYKYGVAVIQDTKWSHERWAPYLMAAGREYLPGKRASDADVYREARAALERG